MDEKPSRLQEDEEPKVSTLTANQMEDGDITSATIITGSKVEEDFTRGIDESLKMDQKSNVSFDASVKKAKHPEPDINSHIDKEKIASRLNKILESDVEKGHEKVSLFAGRCALRVFPLAVLAITRIDSNKPAISQIDYISTIWRAMISGWHFTPEVAFNAAAAAQAARDSRSAVDLAAYAGIAAAAAEVATSADKAAFFAYTTFTAIDAGAIEGAAASFDDLIDLESSAIKPAKSRRKALWGSKGLPSGILELDWSSSIDKLIAGTDVETEKNLLLNIKRDYQAILNGRWEQETKSVIKETAVEQTENDSPSEEDFLGRDRIVNALLPRLSIPDDADHLTIGLLGNWGIGKSSVIEQLKKKLDETVWHTEYIYGEFNAWSYEKTPNLHAGITQELISALTTARPEWPWTQGLLYKPLVIGEFAARLHGVRIVCIVFLLAILVVTSILSISGELAGSGQINGMLQGVAGIFSIASLVGLWQLIRTVSAQPLAKELKTYLRLPSYQQHLGTIPVMQRQIRALCDICLNGLWSHKQRRLIFFIDDLDRCGEDGIVQTFEAVRLILGIPWVTVIIAMDQRIALPALACRYKQISEFHQNDPMSIARDYLGKVIHVPISLSEPDDIDIARYLAKLWDDQAFYDDRKPVKVKRSDTVAEVDPQEEVEQETNNPAEPSETLQDIIDDINKMDVRAVLMPEKDEQPIETDMKTIQQLSAAQKEAFYNWLLKLNLRNPRQIKRLYNSYNLLWSYYRNEWSEDEHGHPYLVALFLLEMINEFVAYSETEDTKALLREKMFSTKEIIKMPEIPYISFDDISHARKIIYNYQSTSGTQLLSRIEPFVLPASSPQQINESS